MAMESLLETLPPEIRRHLLFTLDLEELKILVHASPVFHEQYLLDRRFLLCRCLENTLGSVAIDACAVYRTGSVEFARTRTSASIGQFLVTYGKQRFRGKHHSPIAAERLGLDEAVNMAMFHRSIILPLVRHLATWTLANLAVETGRGDRAYGHDPQLSRTEEVRLTRALYRFQLACNLFGRGVHGSSERPQLDLSTAGILDYFICLFEPWEVEEFSCVHMLAKQSYEAVFHAILWDVHEENPKFHGQRSSTPPGSFELDNSWVQDCLLKGTISRGLQLLHTILFGITDHASLVSTMQNRMCWPAGAFLGEEALGETAQFRRRYERATGGRDEKEHRREPLPFAGDKHPDDEADGDDNLYPPLAWTLLWKATYSNLYGYYVHEEIRRWGYVMWDAARLEQTGGVQVLARQWGADWGKLDPRDRVLV